MAFKEWRPTNLDLEKYPVVICVHGLTRNCNDFDFIASHLSAVDHYRVLCVDVPGRGNSSPLESKTEYGYPTYVRMFKEWLSALLSGIYGEKEPEVYWVGTSMGGLIGMMLNASVDFPLIKKLVLNDIGPFVSAESLNRLKRYCGTPPIFDSFSQVKDYLRDIYSPFEPLDDEQWNFIVRGSVKPVGESKHPDEY